MELVEIFVDSETKEGLYAVIFSGENVNEFDRLFDNWSDTEYVTYYCDLNKGFFESDYFQDFTISEIISRILLEAERLETLIEEYTNSGFQKSISKLQSLFKPLNDKEINLPALQQTKAKIRDSKYFPKPILRVYGLRIEENTFVITGGAIKITHKMIEHKDTIRELEKLEEVKQFLKTKGINCFDEFLNYYSDES